MNQCHPLPLHKLLKGQTFFLEVESVITDPKHRCFGKHFGVTESPQKVWNPKMVCKKLCGPGPLGGGCETHHPLVVRSLFSHVFTST